MEYECWKWILIDGLELSIRLHSDGNLVYDRKLSSDIPAGMKASRMIAAFNFNCETEEAFDRGKTL